MILAQGIFLAIFGILVSSASVKRSPTVKEVISAPEYVLKYAFDHVEDPGASSKYIDEHSAIDEDKKRITHTNTVFFKHKVYPIYSYFDYPLEKISHSELSEKKFTPEHPILRPEVKIIPFTDEKKIEHPDKKVKLVHLHFPEEKEVIYPSPVHYFEDLPYAHLEKEVPFKLEKEIVDPFHLEKTVPFEFLFPIHEEEKLPIPLMEANSQLMKEDIIKDIINSTDVRKNDNNVSAQINVDKMITNTTHSQQKLPPNQENQPSPMEQQEQKEKLEKPAAHPIQVNIPVKQLGKDVQVTPFLIKFEIPKEEEEEMKKEEDSKNLEPVKE